MSDMSGLEKRLASLLEDAAERRARERTQREREMQVLEPRRARFEDTAAKWMNDLIIPRLRTLAQALPQAGDVEHDGGEHYARLKFASSEEFPVAACLTVSIVPNARYERASVHVQPLLIPMLAGHPSASCCEIETDTTEAPSLAQFLDDQCVVFAESYLRVREPDSLYQRNSLVTDPVCGMTFHRPEAVASHVHGGRRFYFCSTSCADQFRQSPDRHSKTGQGASGGVS